jgi:hypothetical protein
VCVRTAAFQAEDRVLDHADRLIKLIAATMQPDSQR